MSAGADCEFYLKGMCKKVSDRSLVGGRLRLNPFFALGWNCEFRHCEAVRNGATQECKFFASGRCTKTDCPFRHAVNVFAVACGTARERAVAAHLTQNPSSLLQTAQAAHTKKSTPAAGTASIDRESTPCYWLTQPGGCKKGASCPYSHADVGVSAAFSTASLLDTPLDEIAAATQAVTHVVAAAQPTPRGFDAAVNQKAKAILNNASLRKRKKVDSEGASFQRAVAAAVKPVVPAAAVTSASTSTTTGGDVTTGAAANASSGAGVATDEANGGTSASADTRKRSAPASTTNTPSNKRRSVVGGGG
jgi:hypothetical protein